MDHHRSADVILLCLYDSERNLQTYVGLLFGWIIKRFVQSLWWL